MLWTKAFGATQRRANLIGHSSVVLGKYTKMAQPWLHYGLDTSIPWFDLASVLAKAWPWSDHDLMTWSCPKRSLSIAWTKSSCGGGPSQSFPRRHLVGTYTGFGLAMASEELLNLIPAMWLNTRHHNGGEAAQPSESKVLQLAQC